MNYLMDIGLNLTDQRFADDHAEVMTRARDAGVVHSIITGTSAHSSQQAHELCTIYDNCFSTAGCHPHDADRFTAEDLVLTGQLLAQDSVVAVGECGLDFNRNFSTPENQERVFRQQIELACRVNKPLFMHERDASERFLSILSEYKNDLPKAVIHCFTGSQQSLEQYLDFGLYIGITGWICDERRGQDLAEIVHLIPDDKLLLETDAPYLTPRDLRPKPKKGRNEPAFLVHIAQRIAELRQQTFEHVAQNSYRNSIKFFELDSFPQVKS